MTNSTPAFSLSSAPLPFCNNEISDLIREIENSEALIYYVSDKQVGDMSVKGVIEALQIIRRSIDYDSNESSHRNTNSHNTIAPVLSYEDLVHQMPPNWGFIFEESFSGLKNRISYLNSDQKFWLYHHVNSISNESRSCLSFLVAQNKTSGKSYDKRVAQCSAFGYIQSSLR